MGGGEGGDVDTFVGGPGGLQEEFGDSGADGGQGGKVHARVAEVVVDGGGVGGNREAEEAGLEAPGENKKRTRLV